MREFCVVPHGAGKNFLGALQHYIEGTLTRDRITNRISESNLFDGDYKPVNFVKDWFPRTTWNKELLECQAITEKLIYNTIQPKRAEQEIRNNVNKCHQGSFCFGFTIPHIKWYSIVCFLDNPQQRIWLDDLAMLKKEGSGPDPNRQDLSRRLMKWELEQIPNYRAEWVFDYTSMFLVKDPTLIQSFIDRTCFARQCKTLVTTKDLQEIIEFYTAKNIQLLEQYD